MSDCSYVRGARRVLDYRSARLDSIENANLRAALDAEAEQLDRISQGVSAMRTPSSNYEAAEDIIRSAADRPQLQLQLQLQLQQA